MRRLTAAVLLIVLVFGAAAAAQAQSAVVVLTATPSPAPEATPRPVELLVPEVLSVRPHDPTAFTQGLLLHDGFFYESAGLYGQSSLRQTDPETGSVLRQVAVADDYFAEGLALVEDRLIQLTWKEETALVYDLDTFELVDTLAYTGEGWGLCYDGQQLYMSDGTGTLTIRDPLTFEPTGSLPVTLEGEPLSDWAFQNRRMDLLNELECVDDAIYANLWQTDLIVRIDHDSGEVTAVIFAANLLTPQEQAALDSGAVLNGIAHDPETGAFFITGKLWPKLFEVRFVPVQPPG